MDTIKKIENLINETLSYYKKFIVNIKPNDILFQKYFDIWLAIFILKDKIENVINEVNKNG